VGVELNYKILGLEYFTVFSGKIENLFISVESCIFDRDIPIKIS